MEALKCEAFELNFVTMERYWLNNQRSVFAVFSQLSHSRGDDCRVVAEQVDGNVEDRWLIKYIDSRICLVLECLTAIREVRVVSHSDLGSCNVDAKLCAPIRLGYFFV